MFKFFFNVQTIIILSFNLIYLNSHSQELTQLETSSLKTRDYDILLDKRLRKNFSNENLQAFEKVLDIYKDLLSLTSKSTRHLRNKSLILKDLHQLKLQLIKYIRGYPNVSNKIFEKQAHKLLLHFI